MARPFPAATSPFLIIGCGSVEPMGRYPAEQAWMTRLAVGTRWLAQLSQPVGAELKI